MARDIYLSGIFIVTWAVCIQCFAAESTVLKIHRIKGEIVLDGLSTESAWDIIPSVPMVIQRPTFGKEPTERTEVLIGYDDDYLYVAGRLYDKEPQKIQATSYKRDCNNASSEWFGVALDTYNDKENALAFFTTPTGLRWDANIVEGAGGISISTDWNTYWDVATAQNEDGWFAEFRIPFSSLRFQERDGTINMGLISWRLISRKNEWIIFPAIPDNWPTSFYKISEARQIAFDGIRRKNPFYVSLYGLTGREVVNNLSAPKTSYQKKITNKFEPGLDIKYGITSNFTLDATINTDFSQVEIDDRVISLDRFSVYMPEKRRFFLERSRNFDFAFQGSNQVFYSRRIGINGDKPVRIYGGGRIVSQIGKTDIGLINMQTAALDSFPSENVGVLRIKRQVFDNNSYLGCITTTKLGTDGRYNIVYGLDGVFQIKDDDYIKIAAAQSQESKNNQNLFSDKSLRYQIELERRSNIGFCYLLGLSFSGKEYNPALGFENWQNYQSAAIKLHYSWLASEISPFYKTTIDLYPFIFRSNSDNNIDMYDINPLFNIDTKSGFQYTLVNHFTYDNVRDTIIFLNNVQIPRGKYSFHYIEAEIKSPDIYPIKTSINLKTGSYYDGSKTSFLIQPTWNVSRNLELESTYQIDKINIPARGQTSVSHLFRIKSLFMLNTSLSMAAFIQYSNIEKICVSNLRFHYNPKEGTDLYFVYNHGFNIEQSELSPVPPVTNSWNVCLKYSYTFVF